MLKNRLNDEVKRSTNLFFYLADEGDNVLNLSKNVLKLKESSLMASGSRSDIGNWQMHLKSQVTCLYKDHRIFSYCRCWKFLLCWILTILTDLHLQNHLETHYCGFKKPDIVNLSDLVQQNLAVKVIYISTLQVFHTVFLFVYKDHSAYMPLGLYIFSAKELWTT